MPNRFNDQINNGCSLDCNDEMWDLLSSYTDGEATLEEAARVEEMLRSDSSYARQFAFMKTTASTVQSFAELDPPSSLREAILASTSQRVTWAIRLMWLREAVRRSLAPRYAMSLAGLAAAGLLAFVVVHFNSRQSVNGNPSGMVKITQPSLAPDSATKQPLVTENAGSLRDVPIDVPSIAIGAAQPQAPAVRTLAAVMLSHVGKKIPSVAAVNPPAAKNRVSILHHEDNPGVAIAEVYQPDMDRQFERNSGSVAAPDNQPVEIQGDDVHIADSDPTPTAAPTHPATTGSVTVTAVASHADAPHIIVAKLPALPPDPNQIMTRADMARNRAVFTSGYDRSTLRSMERKETSISILHGSF